ncbi:hypothetical protein VT52_024195 [Streptomyces malaysiense]|uniref:Uncharacterized protein n=1 Tax=Streptomyces malaysiense TaxID=1428626 RepID=A0A1J4PYM4_9ACTN|nr:hypothetical protein VT52_024195 [Streptomyces malaysiense]
MGTGLPTAANTHEIARRLVPGSRAGYVGDDPIVPVRARSPLTGSPEGVTDHVDADVHGPGTVLRRAADPLGPERPVEPVTPGTLRLVLDTGAGRGAVEPGPVPRSRWCAGAGCRAGPAVRRGRRAALTATGRAAAGHRPARPPSHRAHPKTNPHPNRTPPPGPARQGDV